jgi:hypothetical protein
MIAYGQVLYKLEQTALVLCVTITSVKLMVLPGATEPRPTLLLRSLADD